MTSTHSRSLMAWAAVLLGCALFFVVSTTAQVTENEFAKPPKDATRPGGLGMPFDWSILEGYQQTRPTLLSGGLTVENVAEAVEATRLSGVDVSSGVESEPGRKDPVLIDKFVRTVRAASLARA